MLWDVVRPPPYAEPLKCFQHFWALSISKHKSISIPQTFLSINNSADLYLFCMLFTLKINKQSFPNSQILPLLPPPLELPGCASRMGRPCRPPFRCPASPWPSPPPTPPSSPRPVTLATGSMMTGPSTWPSATWDGVVDVTHTAPPTAATSAWQTTSRLRGIPWRCRPPDAHPTRKARKVLAGPPEATHAHFLTPVSIKNSETVSKYAGVLQHPEINCTF